MFCPSDAFSYKEKGIYFQRKRAEVKGFGIGVRVWSWRIGVWWVRGFGRERHKGFRG